MNEVRCWHLSASPNRTRARARRTRRLAENEPPANTYFVLKESTTLESGTDSPGEILASPLMGSTRYWIFHVLGWLSIWIVFSIGILADPAPQIELTNVKFTTGLCVGGFFASHVLRFLIHRLGWKRRPWGELVPRVILLCCLLGPVEATILAPFTITNLTFGSLRALGRIAQWSASACASAAMLLGWSAAYLSYQFQKRSFEH
jgi:hypothetical protein